MKRQAALLTQLVDDLLDVSRVTRNRIELQLAELDLARLVAQVCDGFRSRAMEPRHQQLSVELPGRPVMVSGDAGRLEQVLTNLLDNASKYSDPRTRIEVALRVAGGSVELSVRDQGIGIDALMCRATARASIAPARSRPGSTRTSPSRSTSRTCGARSPLPGNHSGSVLPRCC